jgi:hypothetical protein
MAKKTKKQIEDELPRCPTCKKIFLVCKCKDNKLES